jgi:transcriptional regulator with XRE-family HTH domain
MSPAPDRKRAARYVLARMGELGLTREELADRAGLDRKTVYNLLSGERWPHERTRGALERVLSWYPGDLLRVAEGGEPVAYERPPSGRELLADFARQRMAELGLGWNDVIKDGDFSEVQVDEIRRQWDLDRPTRRSLERALRWEPGSIDLIFSEGRPPATIEAWRTKSGRAEVSDRPPIEMLRELKARFDRIVADPERRDMLDKFTRSIDPGDKAAG